MNIISNLYMIFQQTINEIPTINIILKKVIIFLFAIGSVTIVIAIISYIQNLQKNRKKNLINHTIGTEQLQKILGRDKVHFPIIAFGKSFIEPVHIKTMEQYENEYLFSPLNISNSSSGIDAEYIIDRTGNKYSLQSKILESLGETNEDIKDLKFTQLQNNNEVIPFNNMKKSIISTIKELSITKNGSVYEDVLQEIKDTNSIEELVLIMDKSNY